MHGHHWRCYHMKKADGCSEPPKKSRNETRYRESLTSLRPEVEILVSWLPLYNETRQEHDISRKACNKTSVVKTGDVDSRGLRKTAHIGESADVDDKPATYSNENYVKPWPRELFSEDARHRSNTTGDLSSDIKTVHVDCSKMVVEMYLWVTTIW